MTHAHLLPFALITFLIASPGNEQATSVAAPSGTWRIDPARSLVQFTVTKLGFADVTGRFTDFTGSVRYDAAHPENSSVQWTVRVASVQTGEPGRDSSLQAPEYFDARRHPELTFRSVRVSRRPDGGLDVQGEITMKGIARPLGLIARPVDGGFESTFELNRFDFDIVGGSVMRLIVGRTARIKLVAVAERDTQRSTTR